MDRQEAINWIELYIDLETVDPTTGEEVHLNKNDRKILDVMQMAITALSEIDIYSER